MDLVCRARKELETCSTAVEAATRACRNLGTPAGALPAVVAALANILTASPANAGVLFDFNLTLPIIMAQFLVLMFVLDKVVFSPVGEILNERDADMKSKMNQGESNEEQIAALEKQAKEKFDAARRAWQEKFDAAEAKVNAELAEFIAAEKSNCEKDIAIEMAALKAQEEESLKTMDAKAEELGKILVAKVFDEGMDVEASAKSVAAKRKQTS